MIGRRAFIAGRGALCAAASVRVEAQPASTPRIGWICYTPPGVALDAFQEGMRALGYTGPRAVAIDVRVVENKPDRVKATIDELLGLGVALVVSQAAVGPAAQSSRPCLPRPDRR